MKKIRCFFIALLICACTGLYAADATVTFVSGKVEVQRGDKWVPLQKGDTLSKSDTVSTGFQSEAKIKIMDSVMYLGPVTRITLEELSTKGNTDNVNVYLKTGAARSQVRHVDNKRVNYQVHTAVAVASCRGTDWIIDSNNKVLCLEGMVAVAEYIPPKINDDTEGEKKEDDKQENQEKQEEQENKDESEDSKEEGNEAGEEVAEGGEADAAGGNDGVANLSSDDGILLTENCSIQVSDQGVVSAPVNNVVQDANDVINSVSTAAEQAKEETNTTNTQVMNNPEPTPEPAPEPTPAPVPGTGTVIVTIDF